MLRLEDIIFAIERRVIWPVQDLFAGRRTGVGALVALGVAATVAGILILSGGGEAPRQRSAEQARVAIAPAPQPAPLAAEPRDPTLQGVPPRFGTGGVGAAKASGGGASGDSASAASSPRGSVAGSSSSDSGTSAAPADEPAAAASTAGKPVPAGPAAMKVAHRFAEAFVFYEIGEKPARAKAVFGETATEQLAKALEERPPRLPANGRVPKAKVLNVVAGPRFGRQYTVSVSLLRVDVTSELRVTLKKEKEGEWRVASILG
jgi:hypothetical protein